MIVRRGHVESSIPYLDIAIKESHWKFTVYVLHDPSVTPCFHFLLCNMRIFSDIFPKHSSIFGHSIHLHSFSNDAKLWLSCKTAHLWNLAETYNSNPRMKRIWQKPACISKPCRIILLMHRSFCQIYDSYINRCTSSILFRSYRSVIL